MIVEAQCVQIILNALLNLLYTMIRSQTGDETPDFDIMRLTPPEGQYLKAHEIVAISSLLVRCKMFH